MHDHQHGHGHGHESNAKSLSFEEKAAKLIDHWIRHNDEHGRNYTCWARDFRNHGFSDAADLLDVAEELSRQITGVLKKAAGVLPDVSSLS
jgi:hypothetical protein